LTRDGQRATKKTGGGVVANLKARGAGFIRPPKYVLGTGFERKSIVWTVLY